ncbi:hypothetical protein RMONA_05710 [Rickettsia monacensis]|uniref:Uncharacterized protein n=1 Tax=Rickettsia monacensis TaxID=109232 RepID=A0A0B7J3E4_9RICK|nr:hypothetical protein RMONA_7625 [Rickettsia monacensis IrR/Munich]CEO17515.1 hypothetical protein RMONA_05710 [Rickettsia monacensis]
MLSKPERANKVLHKISGKPFIFLFTALDNMSLDELLKDNIEFLNSNVDLDLESLSYSLNCRKNHFDEKILFIADSIVDLKNKIQSYLNNRELIQYEKHYIDLENVLEFLSKKSLDNDKNIYLNMLEKLATEILSGKNLIFPQFIHQMHKK